MVEFLWLVVWVCWLRRRERGMNSIKCDVKYKI